MAAAPNPAFIYHPSLAMCSEERLRQNVARLEYIDSAPNSAIIRVERKLTVRRIELLTRSTNRQREIAAMPLSLWRAE